MDPVRKLNSNEEYVQAIQKFPRDAFFSQARLEAENLGKGRMLIGEWEGQMIRTLVTLYRPTKIVEIGTLTGFSALCFLSALQNPAGKLWTFEKEEKHAQIARRVLDSSPWGGQVEVVLGDAAQTLPSIESHGPFDLIFIDGNKASYVRDFDWARKNIRLGGAILADNVFGAGEVEKVFKEPGYKPTDYSINQLKTIMQMNEMAFRDSNLLTTILPSVEGMLLSVKVK